MMQALSYAHYGTDPYFNMAFDELMLSRVTDQPSQILLRLYTWSEATITYGANQRRETALDFDRLGDTLTIRRVTGGRALYHDLSEYTYSLAWNRSAEAVPALCGKPSAAYRHIAGGLVEFLAALGREANYVRRSSKRNARPEVFHREPCFASHARHEVISDDQKIIASAALQYGSAVLQHGSIKLHGVATHPALPGATDRGGQRSAEPPVESQDSFWEAAQILSRTMGRQLGVAFASDATDYTADEGLIKHLERVRKNPHDRRLIFARK